MTCSLMSDVLVAWIDLSRAYVTSVSIMASSVDIYFFIVPRDVSVVVSLACV